MGFGSILGCSLFPKIDKKYINDDVKIRNGYGNLHTKTIDFVSS